MAGDVSEMHWDPGMALEGNTMKKVNKELLTPQAPNKKLTVTKIFEFILVPSIRSGDKWNQVRFQPLTKSSSWNTSREGMYDPIVTPLYSSFWFSDLYFMEFLHQLKPGGVEKVDSGKLAGILMIQL